MHIYSLSGRYFAHALLTGFERNGLRHRFSLEPLGWYFGAFDHWDSLGFIGVATIICQRPGLLG